MASGMEFTWRRDADVGEWLALLVARLEGEPTFPWEVENEDEGFIGDVVDTEIALGSCWIEAELACEVFMGALSSRALVGGT